MSVSAVTLKVSFGTWVAKIMHGETWKPAVVPKERESKLQLIVVTREVKSGGPGGARMMHGETCSTLNKDVARFCQKRGWAYAEQSEPVVCPHGFPRAGYAQPTHEPAYIESRLQTIEVTG
jgi:hypothetical protein